LEFHREDSQKGRRVGGRRAKREKPCNLVPEEVDQKARDFAES